MKKIISAFLSVVMLAVMSVSAFAADSDRFESVAYRDLGTANDEMRAEILEAREEIIFSKSWVADGISGQVLDQDGNVVEELPQFSELFPADWDMPSFPVQETAIKTPMLISPASTRIAPYYDGDLTLSVPPADTNTPAFCSFATTGNKGTAYEYTYKKIYTYGVYGNPGNTAYYNVGYTNASTGASLGWKVDLPNGKTYSIDAPKDVTVAVRASSNNYPGTWYMSVTASD